jgi:HK97 family phage major capsid protein
MSIKNATELRAAKQTRKEKFDQLKAANKPDMTADERSAWDALKIEYDAIDADIQGFEAASERTNAVVDMEARAAQPQQSLVPGKIPAEPRSNERLHVFKNLGEQLAAVRRQATTGQADERLNQLEAESRALGMTEGLGSDAGFSVQTDFAGAIFESAAQQGDLYPLVDSYPVSAGANSARWIEIDEDDVSETVFGGVQVYWAAEAKTVAASKPQTQEQKIDLEKLMGFAYVTEETLQDTVFASRLYTTAFGVAINRKLEAGIVDGNGIGQLTGILKSNALVSVAKESGQLADTIDYKNFAHMWGRLLPRLRSQAVWLIHPDVEEILPLMTFPVGVGGVPVFLPAGGISGSPFSTLYGRSIIPMDHCAALGDKGDVILTAPKEYVVFNKGGVQEAWSPHVAFLTAENCFRVIFRANGRPKMSKSLTIKNSTNKRSAYVTLDARA